MVTAAGVGRFSDVVLDRMLSGKAVGVRPFIGEISHGMAGGSTPQDLETMLQLVYLRFTQPRADNAAFAALAAQRGAARQSAREPRHRVQPGDRFGAERNRLRRQPETPATVEKWDLAKSLAFYKARFADASNFTFVFVGSFTPEGLKPLVETYIASLPATRSKETWRDPGISLPTGLSNGRSRKASPRRARSRWCFPGRSRTTSGTAGVSRR